MQNYGNHRKFFPLFHFVAAPLLITNLVWQFIKVRRVVTTDTVIDALTAVGLIALALAARTMALKVQDRVIRLEMRLRLRQVLPAALAARIGDLTHTQLVGLRFASDAELPGLVQQVLDQKIASATQIKKMIQAWEADHLRA
jgi:hypothetical protein